MKIKKKEAILPFRQTMAYRMLMLTLAVLFFLYTVYEMTMALRVNNTVAFVISAIAGVLASIAIFLNIDKLRYAKVPANTLKRMKRR